jgi:hypothetical protein
MDGFSGSAVAENPVVKEMYPLLPINVDGKNS